MIIAQNLLCGSKGKWKGLRDRLKNNRSNNDLKIGIKSVSKVDFKLPNSISVPISYWANRSIFQSDCNHSNEGRFSTTLKSVLKRSIFDPKLWKDRISKSSLVCRPICCKIFISRARNIPNKKCEIILQLWWVSITAIMHFLIPISVVTTATRA